MKTELASKTKKALLDTEGPFVVIGEKTNLTALQEGNLDYVRELASKQVAAGADVLDVNVGAPAGKSCCLNREFPSFDPSRPPRLGPLSAIS